MYYIPYIKYGYKLNIIIHYPYHLCPICGMQSNTTSRVCSKHLNVTYDVQGNVVDYKNTQSVTPSYTLR